MQDDVVLEPSLREFCEANQCGQYGSNWMCPPSLGTYEELTEELRSCGNGILMQMIYQLEDSYDVEGWRKALEVFDYKLRDIANQISRHIPREELLILGAGPCRYCEICTIKNGEPCLYPNQAIASVEAYSIEVSSTIKNVGLEYNNGPNTVSTVAILLERSSTRGD
ncbi:DUF2284 domain-containing protein [Anaeromicrobium sediminis]|uniref:DUF2284 domain-containing protein n=1 Tax=Anaeromicrobium sediminis TaxID=1478221 RepID=UPI001FA8D769|nr:DUF2284 domain-containing protein [Anaeromicrobium sediminis]